MQTPSKLHVVPFPHSWGLHEVYMESTRSLHGLHGLYVDFSGSLHIIVGECKVQDTCEISTNSVQNCDAGPICRVRVRINTGRFLMATDSLVGWDASVKFTAVMTFLKKITCQDRTEDKYHTLFSSLLAHVWRPLGMRGGIQMWGCCFPFF